MERGKVNRGGDGGKIEGERLKEGEERGGGVQTNSLRR